MTYDVRLSHTTVRRKSARTARALDQHTKAREIDLRPPSCVVVDRSRKLYLCGGPGRADSKVRNE